MAIPKNITGRHLLLAIEQIIRDGYDSDQESKLYDLLYDGNYLPPKVVVRYANKMLNHNEIKFRGGEKHTNHYLRKNGFIVVHKNISYKDDFFHLEEIEYFYDLTGQIYNKNNPEHVILINLLAWRIKTQNEYVGTKGNT